MQGVTCKVDPTSSRPLADGPLDLSITRGQNVVKSGTRQIEYYHGKLYGMKLPSYHFLFFFPFKLSTPKLLLF